MADTKISALTAVTNPALTDEFAVNQAGVSKKMTLAQIISLAAPTFVAAGAVASGTGDVTPPLYAGHTLNDIIVCVAQTANEAVAAPTGGWLKMGPVVGFGTAAAADSNRLTAWWKRHDGSETDPTILDAGNHIVAFTFGLRGCSTTGDPFVSVGQKMKRTASTTGTAHAGVTHVDNCLIVNLFAHAIDTASAVFSAPTNASLTSVTEQVDVSATDGVGGGIGVVTGVLAAAGPFAGTTVTMTSGVDANSTFYFCPAGTTISGAIDRQEFISPGITDTWTKPVGAKQAQMWAIGGGGSGSAGRNAATAAGGGAGGGGHRDTQSFGAAELTATLSVAIGKGGALTANTDGAVGTGGTASSVTDTGGRIVCYGAMGNAATASATGSGGPGGSGGGRNSNAAAGVGTYTTQGGGGGTGGTTAMAGGFAVGAAGGGGAGGGTTQVASAGGAADLGGGGGGGGRSNTNFGTGGASLLGGQVAGGATVGANGGDSPYPEFGGSGAAGGNSATGPGGSGGWPGGGGGGGGSQSGAQRGGAGGDGVVVIVTYC